jgi:hypothetical protein
MGIRDERDEPGPARATMVALHCGTGARIDDNGTDVTAARQCSADRAGAAVLPVFFEHDQHRPSNALAGCAT